MNVYIHIPFCRSRCTYCGFYSNVLPRCEENGRINSFVQGLCREIAAESEWADGPAPSTLYFGGGTPSLLKPEHFSSILSALNAAGFRPDGGWDEFTVEVNPDDIVHGDTASALRALGVSRISMGVQSLSDSVLRRMGRRHSAAEAATAFSILRRAGFDNISVDLIFGFSPGEEGRESEMASLRGMLEWGPEHVSCYQLSIEDGSALEKMVSRRAVTLPSDEDCADRYAGICRILHEAGYEHYEISNWARPGRRSRHNSAYWHHVPYLGFGPGAHSLLRDRDGLFRRWNNADLDAYMGCGSGFDAVRGSERLTPDILREERLMLGLRTAEGIDGRRIEEKDWFVSDSIIAGLL